MSEKNPRRSKRKNIQKEEGDTSGNAVRVVTVDEHSSSTLRIKEGETPSLIVTTVDKNADKKAKISEIEKTTEKKEKKDAELFNELVKRAKKEYKKDPKNKGIGRYTNYILVWKQDGDLYNFVKENYESNRGIFTANNLQVVNWQSLSYDKDDKDDFGVKYLGDFVYHL